MELLKGLFLFKPNCRWTSSKDARWKWRPIWFFFSSSSGPSSSSSFSSAPEQPSLRWDPESQSLPNFLIPAVTFVVATFRQNNFWQNYRYLIDPHIQLCIWSMRLTVDREQIDKLEDWNIDRQAQGWVGRWIDVKIDR
jgi:hypothetical protein